jgi:Xaa-Pro dipeptidase
MNHMNEIGIKLDRVRTFLGQNKASAVLFGNQNNFSWITGGKDAHVVMATDAAVASILVTPKKAYLLTNTIEELRMYAEEVSKRVFEPLIFPWYEKEKANVLLSKVVGKGRFVSDNGAYGSQNRNADLARLRWQLLPNEIERYREVGQLAVETLELGCRKIKPGLTEHEITAYLGSAILAGGAIPNLILVATDERIRKFRHPPPQDKRLKRHAMLVVCVKKYGLIANVTRFVHFGKLPSELRKKHNAVCVVDAAFNMTTHVGAKASDIFKAGLKAYADQGFRNEWHLHHQGGATGYTGREWLGTSSCHETVLENQAFAWNPSITGTKSEDTVLVRKDGLEILTGASDRWPMIHIHHPQGCIERPDILIR